MFAAGDIVECTQGFDGWIQKGAKGIVSNPPYEGGYLMVRADGDHIVRGWSTWRWRVIGRPMEDTRNYLDAITS